MASKHKKEMKAFNAAEQIRNNLITSLRNCKNKSMLDSILNKYEKNQKKNMFAVGNLTPGHRKTIDGLQETIKELIAEKQLQFPPKPIEEIEVRDNSEEIQNVDEPSEMSKSNDPVPDPTHVDAHIPTFVPTTDIGHQEPVLDLNSEAATSTLDSDLPVIFREIKPERERILARVKLQLDALSDKKAEFVGKYSAHADKYPDDLATLEEFDKAMQATENIYNRVNYLYDAYIHGEIELNVFKDEAAPLLDDTVEEVQTLKSHRGLKEIVINLLAAIFSIGIIHGASFIATGKFEFRLFKPATKSGAIVDELEKEIGNAAAASA
ncbi:hypothetical protein TUM19329_27260 [Legionella antarctica]|uniref:Uncharacterized protein n=1 Tax=Legionella antarctica TaxID=2708020 RepID=A0A6F8T6P8_9GAMM|nr:hypothetical protein [Legionella antarctica]BCA96365.1 hypothetical protein TUM19329_27260 [Legionella antarctica]